MDPSIERSEPLELPEQRMTIDVAWSSFFKVVAVGALVWVGFRLLELAMVLLISILIAVAVDPVVRWLERRGLPRYLASAGVVFFLVCVLALPALVGWSSIREQGQLVLSGLAQSEQRLRTSFPMLERMLPATSGVQADRLSQWALAVASSALRALALLTIGLILTAYLLIEWKVTLEWAIAFVSKVHRAKVRRTLIEAREVVFGYVTGNMATSAFAATFVYTSLTLLHVPAASLLALLAGLSDFVPVLGFALSGGPAVMLAMSVSGTTAVAVAGLYVLYHFVENYVIAPRIYGNRLRLSNLAVLLSFAIGAEIGGVTGAILALPIAATYPAVERIWLADRLSDDTVEKHRKLDEGQPSTPAVI